MNKISAVVIYYSSKKREDAGINRYDGQKTFMEYSNTVDDIYDNMNDYDPGRSRNMLIVNRKCQLIVNEPFIRCKKLHIFLALITRSCIHPHPMPNAVRLSSTHYPIMKIHNKKELQDIATNHSANIDYMDFMKSYRKYISQPYSFLTIDTLLPSDDPLCFRENLLDSL